MAGGGWIKLYRKISESFVWTDANQLKLWLLILMKASHEPKRFLFNGQQIDLSSGQLVTGRDALAFEFNAGVNRDQRIVARTLWRWVKRFEREQMLSIKSTTKYSVITVINWNEYQSSDQQVSNGRPSSVQHLSTNKNDKNEEKEKKKDKSLLLLDENLIQETWENNGFGFLAPKTNQDFEYWIEDFQQLGSTKKDAVELITRAIDIAVDANARNYGYVKAILQNWKTLELTTTEMVDVNAKQRSAKSKPKSKQKKPYQNFEQNDDQYDDLPF